MNFKGTETKPTFDICKLCVYWDKKIGCDFSPSISTATPSCNYRGTTIGLLTDTDMDTYLAWQVASKVGINKNEV